MQPIDQPFHPKWDFFLAWVLLGVVTFWLTHQMESNQGLYAYSALLILLSLFATIVFYGPVLLTRQIIRSGSRGWFVLRVMVSTLMAIVIFCFVLFITGHANKSSEMWSGLFITGAMTYLHWRLRAREIK